MKKFGLMTFLLVGCSTLKLPVTSHRDIASLQQEGPVSFELQLSNTLTFANGADAVVLKFQIKNAASENIQVDLSQLKILNDGRAQIGGISFRDGSYQTLVKPRLKSPTIRLIVQYQDQISEVLEIKTTINPRAEMMVGYKSDSTTRSHVSGLTYTRQDKYPVNQFEGFSISNLGSNRIVSQEDSKRSFDFTYEEQAAQNISLMVTDQPNDTVSHTMHSYFMFFPRTYLPIAEVDDGGEVLVTLPNGEELAFTKSGEIKAGVFTEGPLDVGPPGPEYRARRSYADLKYQGKGIVLRANARGQMPQQGQFETTKIDKLYGNKYSADVLIINGTTGQRCIRPKADFWSSADVRPILFKFPSDRDFDSYLRAKCGFGFPDLNIAVEEAPIKATDTESEIWEKCSASGEIKACLKDEIANIDDLNLKSVVDFDLTLQYLAKKKEEEKLIADIISKEVIEIRSTLLKDASWISQGCLEKSRSLVKSTLLYSNIQKVLKDPLTQNCSTIIEEMEKIALSEVTGIKSKLGAVLSWASVTDSSKLEEDCLKQAKTYIDPTYRYADAPKIYEAPLKEICSTMESSEAFKQWLKSQGAGIEEKAYQLVTANLELRMNNLGQSCVDKYPVESQISRVMYRKPRKDCLINGWPDIEEMAIETAQKDPMVQKFEVNFEPIRTRLLTERHRLQIKIIQKFFP